MQGLSVCVNGDKLNPMNPGFYHSSQSVAAGAAASDNFYPGKCFKWRLNVGHNAMLICEFHSNVANCEYVLVVRIIRMVIRVIRIAILHLVLSQNKNARKLAVQNLWISRPYADIAVG